MTVGEVQIAHADMEDAGACAGILDDWISETAWMPRLWSIQETEGFVEGLIARNTVFCARRNGQFLGFMDLHNGWINCLYLAPAARGSGLGCMFLETARGVYPGGLHLWTFAANTRAISFYRREGFREVAQTNGDNDEGLPDIQMYWPASDSVKQPEVGTEYE